MWIKGLGIDRRIAGWQRETCNQPTLLSRSLRIVALPLLVLAAVSGCQTPGNSLSVLPVSDTHDEYEGWLFRKLSGQGDPPAAEKRTVTTAPKSDVSGMGSGQSSNPQETLQDRYERWLDRKQAGQERPQHPDGSERSIADAQKDAAAYRATQPAADGASAGTSLSSAKPEEDDAGFDWSKLEPGSVWKSTKKAFGYGPNESFAQTTFREGETLFRAKQYDEAAKKFATAADRWPDSTLEEDALFFQAESHFFADRYGKAHDAFLMLFKKYPNTRYLDTCVSRQFAIGRYWEQSYRDNPHWPITPNFTDKTRPWFDTAGNAENAYTSVQLNDPTGPLADDALFAKANFYFTRGYYEEAAHNYDLLRREYPKSKHQVTAHVLGLQSHKQVYQGPFYDVTPLKDADVIASQALRQFPGKLGEERAKIVETRAEIREQRAEREFAAAQFWEKKRAFGSARIYYREIVSQYPGTHYASLAQDRLEAIKTEPDNPGKPFQWLANIFDRKR